MRKFIGILLLIASCQIAFAQKSQRDSLIGRLNTLPQDETRLPILERLSNTPFDFATEQKYANEGVLLATKLKQPKEQEKFITFICRADYNMEDYPAVMAAGFKGLHLSRSLQDDEYSIKFLDEIGLANLFRNDYAEANNYYRKALQLARNLNDTLAMVLVSSHLESGYATGGKADSALLFVRLEYKLVTHSNNPKIEAQMGPLFGDMGEAQSGLNHPDSALFYYNKAMPFLQRSKTIVLIVYTESLIAKAWLKTGQRDSAERHALSAFQLAKKTRIYKFLPDVGRILSQLYEGKDNAKSLFYFKEAMAAADSINGAARARQFQAVVYGEQQRQEELNDAAMRYQHNIQLYAAIGVLLLVTLVGTGLWAANKKQRKVNLVLQDQKQQVENTLKELRLTQQQLVQSEKMASLGELTAGIAHEIQNPLNFVNNFSEVNRELLEELKAESEKQKAERDDQLEIELINDLIENEQKINHHGKRADNIVKGMLEHSRSSSGQKEPTDLNTMADEFLRLSYHGLRSKDKSFNAELITNFHPGLPKINIVQQDIGRVLLNLFNNAFYAVNQKAKTAGEDYKPTVELETFFLLRQGAEVGGLKVRDNGIGIPDAIKDKIMQPFFTTKPTGEGTGLGLSLTYDMVVKGHGGKIEVNTKEGEFTEFIVSLPL